MGIFLNQLIQYFILAIRQIFTT